MSQWYTTKVKFVISVDGKEKKVTRNYLVEGVSVYDAETKMNRYLKDCQDPFEVVGVTLSNYEDVIVGGEGESVLTMRTEYVGGVATGSES